MKKLCLFSLPAVMLVFGLIVFGCDNATTTKNNTGSNTNITYTATANGTANTVTSTKLNFVFSAAVSGLTAEDITITGRYRCGKQGNSDWQRHKLEFGYY